MIRTCMMLMIVAGAYACDNAPQDRSSEPPQGTAPLIELRLGREEPEPGFQVWDEYGGVYIEDRSIVSDVDIEHAWALVEPARLTVSVRLTGDGASRLEEVTKQNVGNRIALVINGELIAASSIEEPLRLEAVDRNLAIGAAIPTDISRERARAIAEAVAARWPERSMQ